MKRIIFLFFFLGQFFLAIATTKYMNCSTQLHKFEDLRQLGWNILLWWNLCHHRVRWDAFVVVSKCRNVPIKTLAAMFESIADYHLKRLLIHWKKPTSDDQRPSRDLMTLWRSGSVWMKRSIMLALRSLGQCLGLPSFRFRRHTLRICRRYKKKVLH